MHLVAIQYRKQEFDIFLLFCSNLNFLYSKHEAG
jgi:hypothetical protein